MTVKNYPGGRPIVILGTDGTDLYGITVDPSGHLQIDILSSVLPTGAATQATLADILAKLDVALSTRALEAGGNLAAILAKLDVALSTRALEAGGNLAAILTALQKMDDWALETNKIFGYNAQYDDYGLDLNAAGGNVTKNLSTVPAGEIRIIQHFFAINYNRVSRVQLAAYVGGQKYTLSDQLQADTTTPRTWPGTITLKAGDYLYVLFVGTVAGDDLEWGALGYKMKVA